MEIDNVMRWDIPGLSRATRLEQAMQNERVHARLYNVVEWVSLSQLLCTPLNQYLLPDSGYNWPARGRGYCFWAR